MWTWLSSPFPQPGFSSGGGSAAGGGVVAGGVGSGAGAGAGAGAGVGWGCGAAGVGSARAGAGVGVGAGAGGGVGFGAGGVGFGVGGLGFGAAGGCGLVTGAAGCATRAGSSSTLSGGAALGAEGASVGLVGTGAAVGRAVRGRAVLGAFVAGSEGAGTGITIGGRAAPGPASEPGVPGTRMRSTRAGSSSAPCQKYPAATAEATSEDTRTAAQGKRTLEVSSGLRTDSRPDHVGQDNPVLSVSFRPVQGVVGATQQRLRPLPLDELRDAEARRGCDLGVAADEERRPVEGMPQAARHGDRAVEVRLG